MLRAGVPATFGRPSMLFSRSEYIVPAMFITSSSEKSTCSPSPSTRARRTAASAATAANVPPTHSVVRPPAMIGGCDARPRVAIDPHSACTVNSVEGRPTYGPVRPNGVIESTTSPGCCSTRRAAPNASSAKDSTTRCASRTSASTCASPGAPTTERFPAARNWNSGASRPARSTPLAVKWRSGSPPGGPTFTTSAPASQNSFVA